MVRGSPPTRTSSRSPRSSSTSRGQQRTPTLNDMSVATPPKPVRASIVVVFVSAVPLSVTTRGGRWRRRATTTSNVAMDTHERRSTLRSIVSPAVNTATTSASSASRSSSTWSPATLAFGDGDGRDVVCGGDHHRREHQERLGQGDRPDPPCSPVIVEAEVLSSGEQKIVVWTAIVCVITSVVARGLSATPLTRRLLGVHRRPGTSGARPQA
jgi:hypothetical protein